jgi:hypothetical protein
MLVSVTFYVWTTSRSQGAARDVSVL